VAAVLRQPWPELPERSVAVTVPSLGDGVVSAIVVQVTKQVGEQVALNEAVADVSTDKVDTEVSATVSGVVTDVLVRPGQEVPVGFPILAIDPAEMPHGGAGT
jgi:2-oxoglutarate dehydrogenase E2 component (dihydrolipoamide succinyltransferase)